MLLRDGRIFVPHSTVGYVLWAGLLWGKTLGGGRKVDFYPTRTLLVVHCSLTSFFLLFSSLSQDKDKRLGETLVRCTWPEYHITIHQLHQHNAMYKHIFKHSVQTVPL